MDTPPPRKSLDPYRIPLGAALILFLLSLIIHFSLFYLPQKARWPSRASEAQQSNIEVVLNHAEVIDSLQETSDTKPDRAKFESDRNLKSDEDTSPESAPSNVAQLRGRPNKSKSSAQSSDSSKVFSLSSADLKDSQLDQPGQRSGTDGQVDSTGFRERLKKGEQLKVSALESDYAQYINRMKKKIAQQWSPQKVIVAQMYNYDEVSVDMGLVLDSHGELVDLKIVNASNFPSFDAETKRAIGDAAPFPNPPDSLIQDNGLIYMPWRFSIYMRQAVFRVD